MEQVTNYGTVNDYFTPNCRSLLCWDIRRSHRLHERACPTGDRISTAGHRTECLTQQRPGPDAHTTADRSHNWDAADRHSDFDRARVDGAQHHAFTVAPADD
ncbi:MAG: hypothetical protein H7338_15445 [Candidatus Sericytochromatia bacterium]|nr:hypothetical protein [Candidatus Sericytochromatia bacterium]